MARRKLTLQQFEDLYDALLANADRLCRDAEVLLASGSSGRANALAILALEESAKAIALHEARAEAARLMQSEPELDDLFWREWSDHIPKLKRVRAFLLAEDYWFGQPPPTPDVLLGPIEDYFADLDRWAAEGNRSKLAGFYVDVDKATGRTVAPRQDTGADVGGVIALVFQIGWQVRMGDHIVFRQYQTQIEAMGIRSPFRIVAYENVKQTACMGSPGWEAFTRYHDDLLRSLQDD